MLVSCIASTPITSGSAAVCACPPSDAAPSGGFTAVPPECDLNRPSERRPYYLSAAVDALANLSNTPLCRPDR